MYNNQSVPPVKRMRLSDTIDVIRTLEPNVYSIVDAVDASWRHAYNRMLQEKQTIEMMHCGLVRKYNDLEFVHIKLQKEHQNLLHLYESQRKHISQLPNQSQVTRLNERIIAKEAVISVNQKAISDLKKQCDAYKDIINKFDKEIDATRQAFEELMKVQKEIKGELQPLKERYEKESADLRQIIAKLEANSKDRDQIIEQMKDQHEVYKTKIADLENEAERLANEKGASKAKKYQKRRSSNVHQEDTLFLLDQNLTWEEYVKRVPTIKSLNFVRVRVDKPNGDVASLEEILGKIPNIQMFGCVFGMDLTESIGLTNKTFVNLLMLQPFKRLRKFYLAGLRRDHFDVDCFLAFMKDHPKCKFYLSFHFTGKNKFKDIAKKLREAYPSKTKLVIDLLRSDLTVTHR